MAQGHVDRGRLSAHDHRPGLRRCSFRFNDLEIIPERKEYRPGETLRLLINTNQANATVLLFVRPTNGVYLPPKLVRLQGKSAVEEIGIVARDMPNFFVEALTVADGKVHDERARSPSRRSRASSIWRSSLRRRPTSPARRPRSRSSSTGPDGKPFAGSSVVAVYDKAVEYISGGSNVPEIKEFFWKWKRHHHPQTESSLDVWFNNLLKNGRAWHGGHGCLRGAQRGDCEVGKDAG